MADSTDKSHNQSDQEPVPNGTSHHHVKNSPSITGDDNEIVSVGDISANSGVIVIGKDIILKLGEQYYSTDRKLSTTNRDTQRQLIRLFVASPGDVYAERDRVQDVVDELNMPGGVAERHGCILQVVDWRDAVPGIVRHDQVSLKQLPMEAWNIFIGILWMRFGTPAGGKDSHTGRYYNSGTKEEFWQAYHISEQTHQPQLLLYRRITSPAWLDEIDSYQLEEVRNFWKEFEQVNKNVGSVTDYAEPDDFERNLRHQLSKLVPQFSTPQHVSKPYVESRQAHHQDELDPTHLEWREHDKEGVRRFFSQVQSGISTTDTLQIVDQLKEWQLLCVVDGKWFFTRSGALLFGPEDRIMSFGHTDVLLTNISSEVARFHGYSLSRLVFTVIDTLIKQTEDIWEDPSSRDSNGRPIKLSRYPQAALVEAVVNFIIHRDYTSNDDAWINIDNDKIEMTNPGISPYSEEELLSAKELHPLYKRNTHIIRVFTRSKLNQRQGGGIKRIMQELRHNGNLFPDGRPALEIKNNKELNRFSLIMYARERLRLASGSTLPTHANVPPLPSLFIGRENDVRDLKLRLGIRPTEEEAVPTKVLTAIKGWPGVGKTTLVAAVAHDPEVKAQFPDGVLWASLGQTPSVFSEITAWARALGLPRLEARTLREASAQLRALLRDKRILLIVDDVWQKEHAEPFRVGGSGCALLVTTSLPEVARQIAPSAGDVYTLGVLTVENALKLLWELAPKVVAEHPEVSRELVEDLEGLPLAIQVAGRLLAAEADLGFDVTDLLREIREGTKLIEAQAPADRAEVANETNPTVAALLRKSTDLLNVHDLDCFAYLGAFAPKPATFDVEAMKAVWQEADPRPTIRTLVNRGLLEPVGGGRFWMHAILVTHARSFLAT